MIQNAYLCSAQPLKLVQTSVPNCKFVCTLWLCFYCFFQFSAKYEGQYFQARTTDARWGHRLHGTAKIPLPLIDVLTIYLCQKTYDPIWSIKVPLKSVIREDTLCLSYDWDDKKNTIFFHSSSAFPVPPLLQPQIKPANHSSFWWCNLRIPFHLPPFSPLN